MQKTPILFFILGLLIIAFLISPSSLSLPTPNIISFYDDNNKIFHQKTPQGESYIFTKIEEIPPIIKDATILLEDQRFYYHWGFDPFAIVRAFWQNLKAQKIVTGASGITQQVIKKIYNPQKRNFLYKISEIFLAFKLEQKFSKTEILEAYLNNIFYGANNYGIQAASQSFFNKTLSELSLNEVVFLVGLPQSPGIYNPRTNLDQALKRKKTVIKILNKNGFFEKYCPQFFQTSLEQCLQTIAKKPIQLERGTKQNIAHHYAEKTWQEFKQLNLPYSNNLKIFTYLNSALFNKAQNIAKKHIEKNKEKNINNAAILILNNKNYGISVMLGSADYFNENIQGYVNNTTSLRQAGSTLKPFTYALAFEQGKTPESLIDDSFIHLKTEDNYAYEPKNYDFKEYGIISYRQALANSYNISAIKITQEIGVKTLLTKLRELGFKSLDKTADNYGLALTLGDGEIRLIDLVQAYSVFPHNGKKYKYSFIKEITLQDQTIYKNNNFKFSRMFSEKSAQFVSDILADNEARKQQFGLNSPLKTSQKSSAKTGTTRNFRDNWTIGFNQNYTVGVWVGNADGSYLYKSSGISGAAPIWHDIMEELFLEPPNYLASHPLSSYKSSENNFSKNKNLLNKDLINPKKSNPLILLPQEGDVFLIEKHQNEAIIFKSRKNLNWYLNGNFFGSGKKLFWDTPSSGEHCIRGEFNKNQIEENCFLIQEE